MQIIDHTESYLRNVVRAGDGRRYEDELPWLFDHYFSCWASKGQDYVRIESDELGRRKRLVLGHLGFLEKRMRDAGIPADELAVVLMVGTGVSNGHAFLREDGQAVAWLALESYETESQVRTFVTHEIVHALQYRLAPDFAFSNRAGRVHFGRQVLTEGVATYATSKLLDMTVGEALWADYVDVARRETWLRDCERQWDRLRTYTLTHWNDTSESEEFFYANDPTGIFKYRAGYYVGERLIRSHAESAGMSPKSLVGCPRKTLEPAILAECGFTSTPV